VTGEHDRYVVAWPIPGLTVAGGEAAATASLRPLVLGVGMTGIVLGVVIGVWMVLVGLAIVASQVALLVRDVDS